MMEESSDRSRNDFEAELRALESSLAFYRWAPTSIERILLEVRRKWAKLDLSQSVLGIVDRNSPSI
jgi:hypothetical protein